MHITLRQLEIFWAVSRYGSVTRAAERLYISQPAASMALSELEKHLGPLCGRSQGAGLKMNGSGRALLPKACELIQRAKELESQFSVNGSGSYEHGSLVLNASSTIGNNLLPKIAMVLNRSEAVKQAVSDGVGIACISSLTAKSSLDSGHLATIGVTGLNLKRNFYLLTHKRKYRSTILNQLCHFIIDWQPFKKVNN